MVTGDFPLASRRARMQTLRVYPEGIRVAIDSGVGYEIGQWRLGEAADSPTVTLEPFVGALYFAFIRRSSCAICVIIGVIE
jgi:hypothetical protein